MARNNPPLGFKKATLGSVLVSSLCTPALANNDVNAEDDVEHIVVAGQRMNDLNKQDTIATKMDVSIKDTGRSIAVLDEDDLKVLAIQDVREAFNYVAGFRGNGPADRTYTARGIRTSIDNVMIDGLRSLQGGEGGTGSRLPSTFNAQSVTFLRGPEAILYGAGVAGGLVNITTKQPTDTASTVIGLNNRSYVSGDTGNFKRNKLSLNVDSTGPVSSENVLYRVLAQYTPSGEHFQKRRETEETLVDGSLTFRLGENTTLTPRIEIADRDVTGGSSYADGVFESNFSSGEITTYGEPVNRGEYYGSEKDMGTNESTSVSAVLKHRFNDDWKIIANVRHNDTESEALDLYISDSRGLGNTIGEDEINRKWVYTFGDDSYDLFDFAAQGTFELGGVENHMVFGYNYRDMDIKFARRFQSNDTAVGVNTISASNPSQQTVGPIPDGFTDVNPAPRNQKDTNVYLKDRITLGDFTVVAGLAYVKQEQSEVRGDNAYSGSYSNTIWDLGTVFNLNDDINLFATYSRAFQPVNARWITQYGQGRTSYDPVEGNNYEVGLKGDFLNSDLSTAVTFFKLDRTNSTQFVRNENGWLLNQLSGKSFESKGVEVDAIYHFSDNFNTSISYAFTRAYNTTGDSTGKQVNNTPKHAVSLWNDYMINKDLRVGFGLRYEGERFDGNYTIDSYVEADAGVYYNLDKWSVSVVVNNLFDKNRAEAGANWVTVQPNAPRSVNLNVSYEL